MATFGIYQFFWWWYGDLNKKYTVFGIWVPNGDGKIQFLIENTTVTIFLQKFDYGITEIIVKINGTTVF